MILKNSQSDENSDWFVKTLKAYWVAKSKLAADFLALVKLHCLSFLQAVYQHLKVHHIDLNEDEFWNEQCVILLILILIDYKIKKIIININIL